LSCYCVLHCPVLPYEGTADRTLLIVLQTLAKSTKTLRENSTQRKRCALAFDYGF
jgi:hypothetical protein